MSRPEPSPPRAIVVGAGLRGTLAAQKLAAAGLVVELIEADDVGAHGGPAVPLSPAGLDGRIALDAAARHAEATSWLAASAPHLAPPVRLVVGVEPGWSGRRAAVALSVHDGAAPLSPTAPDYLPDTELFGRRGPAVELSTRTVDEARFALAALLWAARRGTTLRRGRAITIAPGRVVLEDDVELRADVVIDAAGVAGATRRHVAQLRTAPLAAPACDVEHEGLRIRHVPLRDRSVIEVRSAAPIDVEGLRELLGIEELIDVAVRERQVGAPSLAVLGPGHFALSGEACAELLAPLRQLAVEVGRALGRAIPETIGEDARLEEGEAEITPSLERAHLGAPILRVLEARHGARATQIAERVLAVPREGALVCPCASVIEAELRHALEHEHAGDLAALVRRTELGVGGCQGVRCAARAAQILGAGEPLHALWRRACRLTEDRRAALDELTRGLDVALGVADGAR